MSKNIAISDDVYRQLKREKGDRSFSDVIRDHLEERRRLADVTGEGVLDREIQADVKVDVERLSDGTLSRLDDETL
jgi:predicted CopG family antitoxin